MNVLVIGWCQCTVCCSVCLLWLKNGRQHLLTYKPRSLHLHDFFCRLNAIWMYLFHYATSHIFYSTTSKYIYTLVVTPYHLFSIFLYVSEFLPVYSILSKLCIHQRPFLRWILPFKPTSSSLLHTVIAQTKTPVAHNTPLGTYITIICL